MRKRTFTTFKGEIMVCCSHHHPGSIAAAAAEAASLGGRAGLLLLGFHLINYFPAHLVLPEASNSSCCCLPSTEEHLIMEASRWVC